MDEGGLEFWRSGTVFWRLRMGVRDGGLEAVVEMELAEVTVLDGVAKPEGRMVGVRGTVVMGFVEVAREDGEAMVEAGMVVVDGVVATEEEEDTETDPTRA